MGITSSLSVDKEKEAKICQKEFIEYLGNRYPFGDDELIQLLYYHEQILIRDDSSSFLKRLGMISLSYSGEDPKGVNFDLMEDMILPPSFGKQFQSRLTSTYVKTERDRESISSIISSYNGNSEKLDHLEMFLQGLAECCGRRGGRITLGVIFQYCCDKNNPNEADATMLIESLYRIALACLYLSDNDGLNESFTIGKPSGLIESLRQASSSNSFEYSSYGNSIEGKITKDVFFQWSEEMVPLLSSVLPTFFHKLLFPKKPFPPSRTPFLFPLFHENDLSFLLGGIHGNDISKSYPLLFTFACMSYSLGGLWHRLYSSDADGLSFNRLLLSLLGYAGPTLLIITSTSGDTFGAFTASKWMESRNFYGDSNCFLYQLEPKTNIYQPRSGVIGSNQNDDGTKNYMYCNPEARSKGYDGQAHGIGFGGDTLKPRLYITETLDGCTAQSNDLTFSTGDLISSSSEQRQRESFEIERMEVWGVGGDDAVKEALMKRHEHRQQAAENIRKARKVDKAQFLDDFKSGLIESKAFQHREQIRGRDDAQIDDEHENAYKYE